MIQTSRQLAFLVLRAVYRGAFADFALDNALQQSELSYLDRRLVTELVYGSVRRMRTLDALIDQLAKKPACQQPFDIRTILHLGLYQLRYLNHIPVSAAVNTTVNLVKQNGFSGLAGFVNGLLRQYIRLSQPDGSGVTKDPIHYGDDVLQRLGILHSYPDWIIKVWLDQLGLLETEQLCEWFNRSPQVDLRTNPLRTTIDAVESEFQLHNIAVSRIPGLPQALRLTEPAGSIRDLPGFDDGWWMVQDASAQLVGYFMDPQPGETVVDACAAPGGKTMHLAELMHDDGTIWACDKAATRLHKLTENMNRLGFQSIRIYTGDSRFLPQFVPSDGCSSEGFADRVLVDAPCSGLGTLHRHADARWRQTPDSAQQLSQLQSELLVQAASWVKSGGTLVYATCTLNPIENEVVIQNFLTKHSEWQISTPEPSSPAAVFVESTGWVKVWPHRHKMDGFFMARLKKR